MTAPLTDFDRAVLAVITEHGSPSWNELVGRVAARCDAGTVTVPGKSLRGEIRRALRRLHERGEVRSELAGLTAPGR